MPGILPMLGLFSTLWAIKKAGNKWEPNNFIDKTRVDQILHDDPFIRLTFIH